MIKFNNVSFRYDDKADNVIDSFNLDIQQGEWVALVGHNGSGKSTIAKLMNGLLMPDEGEISINEAPLNDDTVWEVRKRVGMVFQNPENQFVGTTVVDDVAFGLENRGISRKVMQERIENSLKEVRMEGFENHEPHRLSGGQKQRVAIASVIATLPEVLVFDEATAMLDPVGKVDIFNKMQEIRSERELTMVSITHDLNEAVLADRVVALNQGEIWFDGEPREFLKRHDEFEEYGLQPPLFTRISNTMKDQGLLIDQEPISIDELVEILWTSHSNK
ncbi:energy-coupling factor transporter ATPase [Halalkalibacillus sediminis]|uniref:Energy-coupling factor transporter ATPase n=1 Tax=Halalkalibacillus sediminis TaxID=2018042 RepID=A0A2I0QQG6_9BACI|nr:energy-coupling factor transporter ATPase [Halalkalibacillus sediminis]PKR76567.1 energy-coupling factor transporter ATPase [Halalkalibacillus sediminis]